MGVWYVLRGFPPLSTPLSLRSSPSLKVKKKILTSFINVCDSQHSHLQEILHVPLGYGAWYNIVFYLENPFLKFTFIFSWHVLQFKDQNHNKNRLLYIQKLKPINRNSSSPISHPYDVLEILKTNLTVQCFQIPQPSLLFQFLYSLWKAESPFVRITNILAMEVQSCSVKTPKSLQTKPIDLSCTSKVDAFSYTFSLGCCS